MTVGVVAVAQPVPVVDALVAVLGQHVRDARRRVRAASVRASAGEPKRTVAVDRGRYDSGSMPPVDDPDPVHRRAELDAVAYDADGLVPAIVQEEGTNEVLMVGVDEPRRARTHARRPAARGSGAGAARSTGARARRRATASTCATRCYDCDMDVLLFVVEQEGRGACHTGERSCFFRAFGGGADARPGVSRDRRAAVRPSRDDVPRAGARLHGRAGVARGARRPRDAALGVREARRRPRGLPARVGRARRALGPLLVPRSRSGAHVRRARPHVEWLGGTRRPRACPTDRRNARRARGAARSATARRRCPSCRRSTVASSAGWATTPCARSNDFPTSRPTTSASPTRCARSRAGRRVRPLPPAPVS